MKKSKFVVTKSINHASVGVRLCTRENVKKLVGERSNNSKTYPEFILRNAVDIRGTTREEAEKHRKALIKIKGSYQSLNPSK